MLFRHGLAKFAARQVGLPLGTLRTANSGYVRCLPEYVRAIAFFVVPTLWNLRRFADHFVICCLLLISNRLQSEKWNIACRLKRHPTSVQLARRVRFPLPCASFSPVDGQRVGVSRAAPRRSSQIHKWLAWHSRGNRFQLYPRQRTYT